MEEEIPPDAVQDETLYCLPKLDKNAFVGLFVEDIVSPSQFHVRIYGGETSDELENIMIEMRLRYIWAIYESRDIYFCTNFTKIEGRVRIHFVFCVWMPVIHNSTTCSATALNMVIRAHFKV